MQKLSLFTVVLLIIAMPLMTFAQESVGTKSDPLGDLFRYMLQIGATGDEIKEAWMVFEHSSAAGADPQALGELVQIMAEEKIEAKEMMLFCRRLEKQVVNKVDLPKMLREFCQEYRRMKLAGDPETSLEGCLIRAELRVREQNQVQNQAMTQQKVQDKNGSQTQQKAKGK